MPAHRAPLHLHVISSVDHPHGEAWSMRLVRWFMSDCEHLAAPGADIPVYVWRASEQALPPDVPWTDAERTALVLLIDPSLARSEAWREWAQRQASQRRPEDLLLPCTNMAEYLDMGQAWAAMRAIRLDLLPEEEREEDLVLLATHCLVRWYRRSLGGRQPVRMFISHAKAVAAGVSGREIAVGLRDYIATHPIGEVFFDEVGIPAGDQIEDVLRDAIDGAVVIVILTDRFAGRYWCGWEVVTSKLEQRPLLVVDALVEGEPASLAYLGRNRTIRWDPSKPGGAAQYRRIVASALLELLRGEHDERRLEVIRRAVLPNARVCVTGKAPELATLPERAADGDILLLHPDPPLPRYELTLIRRHRPDITPVSATQALAGSLAGQAPLRSRRVALSISKGPDGASNGMHDLLEDQLWTRLATHLLATGAELAYGGDLRARGYTEQLRDLARSCVDAGQPLRDGSIHWYAGWPISAQLTAAKRPSLPAAFKLHLGEMPRELPPTLAPPAANEAGPEQRFAWTLGMRDMRSAMARDCVARVLVGGQMRGLSPWPGLLEEFETSVGKPRFLLGAFGGMARVLIRALQGETPAELTQAFQDDDGRRTAAREYYEARVGPVDLPGRVAALQRLGVDGLRNGLGREENERLFVTRDPTEMIALVLTGLRVSLASATTA